MLFFRSKHVDEPLLIFREQPQGFVQILLWRSRQSYIRGRWWCRGRVQTRNFCSDFESCRNDDDECIEGELF